MDRSLEPLIDPNGAISQAGPLDTSATIETPEHIRFDYLLAGPARRSLAYLIDLAIRGLLVLAFGLVLALLDATAEIDGVSAGAMMVFYFALDWFYYVLFETIWSGRSPGKRLLDLRVVGQDGHSLTITDSMLRNLLRAADGLPVVFAFGWLPIGYALGLVVMARDPMFRRLGDIVAGTVVVIEDRHHVHESLSLEPAPTQAELDELPAHPQLSRAQIEALELFLRRHGTLAPARERELAEMVAPKLAERLGLSSTIADPVRLLGLIYARSQGQLPGRPRHSSPRGADE